MEKTFQGVHVIILHNADKPIHPAILKDCVEKKLTQHSAHSIAEVRELFIKYPKAIFSFDRDFKENGKSFHEITGN